MTRVHSNFQISLSIHEIATNFIWAMSSNWVLLGSWQYAITVFGHGLPELPH